MASAQAVALGGPPASPGAGAFEILVAQGDAADAQLRTAAALEFYLQAGAAHPDDPRVLLKIAKEYSDSTLALTDPLESRRRVEKALEYSRRAVELDPRSEVGMLSIAICYGKLGLTSDTRERIGFVRLVKEYADRALALNPGYAYAHHVLGQWEYEVASLGRTKRLLVDLIYGGLPEASTADAVRHLERAVELEPGTASHHLALGFAYLANGDSAKARGAFARVLSMPCRELYDADCHRQAERAMAGL
jgi:tetratricopeptide (TPR) repeat protein